MTMVLMGLINLHFMMSPKKLILYTTMTMVMMDHLMMLELYMR
jgi:hypothetical protein